AQGGYYGNALQATAYFNIYNTAKDVIQMLLQAGANVNIQGGYYDNALQAAVAIHNYGHFDNGKGVIQMLRNAAADVNTQSGYYNNALQTAAAYATHAGAESSFFYGDN